MERELITVVVPIYNVENYIEKCLHSILEQSYNNLEILIIDDGSTDKSIELCEKLLKKDGRIKIFHKENSGPADTRNYGISKANGKYIMFIDSDDYIQKDLIEVLYENLIRYNVSISSCGYIKVINDNKPKNIISKNNRKDIILETEKDKIQELLLEKITGNYVWNKLYTKELFNDIKFKYGIKFEDMEIMYRLFMKADKISLTNYNGYFYRQRSNNIMSTLDENAVIDLYNVTNERYEYIKDNIPELQDENITRRVYTIYRYFALLARKQNKEMYYSEMMQKEKDFYNKNFKNFDKNIMKIKLYEKVLLKILYKSKKSFYYIENIMKKMKG